MAGLTKQLFEVNRCEYHKPKKLPYLEWFEYAEKKTRNGEKQRQCPKCKLWFFEDEF